MLGKRFKVGDMVRSKTKYGDQDGGMGVVTAILRPGHFRGRETYRMPDRLTIYWSHGESTREVEVDVERIK